MADYEAKIFNEKIKAAALMVRNGALAVATAAIIRWSGEGLELIVALWLAVAAMMTYVGIQLLSLLRPED